MHILADLKYPGGFSDYGFTTSGGGNTSTRRSTSQVDLGRFALNGLWLALKGGVPFLKYQAQN
jgi:hypothetical protein